MSIDLQDAGASQYLNVSMHYKFERVSHKLQNSNSHRSSLTIQSGEVSFLPNPSGRESVAVA